MNKSVLKREVADLLRKRDFINLLGRCESNRQYWQEIRFRLYDLDEVIRWSAIETVARVMEQWWDAGNEEKVRIYIRTLFWSLNDESGGIGWSSAQTIAEIITQNPVLIDPYGSMMISHCIDEPPLLKGCFWGIGRMGSLIKDAVKSFTDEILGVFTNDDFEVLGTAAWAMGEAKFALTAPYLEKICIRSEPVTIYIDGNFSKKPVGKWAEEALMRITATG
jgi:hypothetical protein